MATLLSGPAYNTNFNNYKSNAAGYLVVDSSTLGTLAGADPSGGLLNILLNSGRHVVITDTVLGEMSGAKTPTNIKQTFKDWYETNSSSILNYANPLDPIAGSVPNGGEISINNFITEYQAGNTDIRVVTDDLKWLAGTNGLPAARILTGTSGVNLTTPEYLTDQLLSGTITPLSYLNESDKLLSIPNLLSPQQTLRLLQPGQAVTIVDQNGNIGTLLYFGIGEILLNQDGLPTQIVPSNGTLKIPQFGGFIKESQSNPLGPAVPVQFGSLQQSGSTSSISASFTDAGTGSQDTVSFTYDSATSSFSSSIKKVDGTTYSTIYETSSAGNLTEKIAVSNNRPIANAIETIGNNGNTTVSVNGTNVSSANGFGSIEYHNGFSLNLAPQTSTGLAETIILAADGSGVVNLAGAPFLALAAGSQLSVDGSGGIAVRKTIGDWTGILALSGTTFTGTFANASGGIVLNIGNGAGGGGLSVTSAKFHGQNFTGGDFGTWLSGVQGVSNQQQTTSGAATASAALAGDFKNINAGVTTGLATEVATQVAFGTLFSGDAAAANYLGARLANSAVQYPWVTYYIGPPPNTTVSLVDLAFLSVYNPGLALLQAQLQNLLTIPDIGSIIDFSIFIGDEAFFFTGLDTFYPLVLDLTGAGIDLVPETQSHAHFDVKADGTKPQVSWVGASNGILVFDRNHNGVIDNSSEWFGQNFTANGGAPPAGQTGFSALASLAQAGATNFSKATSKIDAATGKTYFDELQVWVDANQNGVTDPSEYSAEAISAWEWRGHLRRSAASYI